MFCTPAGCLSWCRDWSGWAPWPLKELFWALSALALCFRGLGFSTGHCLPGNFVVSAWSRGLGMGLALVLTQTTELCDGNLNYYY